MTQLGWVHKYKMSLSENISPLENWILDPQDSGSLSEVTNDLKDAELGVNLSPDLSSPPDSGQ